MTKKYGWKYFQHSKKIKFTLKDVLAKLDSMVNENNKYNKK